VDQHNLTTLLAAATPFLRIDGASPRAWRRNVQKGPRLGPWRYEAKYKVLDEACWARTGAVLYFVTDSAGLLRLVGESSRRIKDRWRLSPMHDVQTNEFLGGHALFHSSAWSAIERGLDDEPPPFTVSALFEPDLSRILSSAAESLPAPDTHLCRRVEAAILRNMGKPLRLWNKAGVAA
jgi:hypothetical protein